ncbi:MAG: hypothetical protein Q4C71_01840 [Microbacteriaceae bacterium]|nr:hypothetical protein [Microbacteriaceae bacterium]
MNKSTSILGGITGIALLFSGVGVTNAQTISSNVPATTYLVSTQTSNPAPALNDAELDTIVRALESLPEHLKNADPKTTPNYQEDLSKSLNEFMTKENLLPGGISVRASWWECGIQVALTVVQYGIPVGKIIHWIKNAGKLWGGIKGVWEAITRGYAAAEIGEEGAQVLEMLLGYEDLVRACFG